MTRSIVAGLMLFCIVCGSTGLAQSRTGRSGGGSSAQPAAPFRSGAVFVPRVPSDGRSLRVPPFGGLLPSARVFPLWWLWDPALRPDTTYRVWTSPEGAATGGVQLDVLPWSAQVYLDGAHVGQVDQFSGYYHPLEVAAGVHLITLVMPGYEPLVLEITAIPGRTTTYRATLMR